MVYLNVHSAAPQASPAAKLAGKSGLSVAMVTVTIDTTDTMAITTTDSNR